MIYAIYLWAAFWSAMIAWTLPEAPRNKPILCVFGCVFIGIMWPITLPMHLMDLVRDPG
jgi:hypothetical protein